MRREQQPIDAAARKGRYVLLAVAQPFTHLRPIARRGELAGPCPACGGAGALWARCHIKGERFSCRQCTPRGGDVIDRVQRVYPVDFRAACAILQTNPSFSSVRPVVAVEPGARRAGGWWQSAAYPAPARRTMAATQRLLLSGEGAPGRAYLAARGLTEVTWRTYRLGLGRTLHPVRREKRAAICIPWCLPDYTLVAIQHRFIDPELGKHARYRRKPGSQALLFGLPALTTAARLLVVAGEFTWMALHQVDEQAVSLGSETDQGNRAAFDLLREKLSDYAHGGLV